MLDVCLLGTGGMMPLHNRWLTSLLVRHNGKMILIDCGEGTQVPIGMSKWGFKSIDIILFTHYHADHIAGLPGLLLTIGNTGKEEPLILMGPAGLKEIIEGLRVICPVLPYELQLIEISDANNFEMERGDLVIKSALLEHGINCVGYSIEIKRQGRFDVEKAKSLNVPIYHWNRLQKGETVIIEGKKISADMVIGATRRGIKICYSTDTRPTDNLTDLAKDSDLFICEGIYGDEDYKIKAIEKRHMIFSEAASIAKYADVKELWLTHYSPSLTEPEQYLENAKVIFENTIAGKDLMFKTINFEN